MACNMEKEEKTVYRILSIYLNHAEKTGDYVKGSIDGKERLELFLNEYNQSARTKFIIRSSCKKNKEFNLGDANTATDPCTRYGRADRIYWEFNNRKLIVPFCGMPFVTKSSQVKHCQFGAQYYKLKEEKQSKSTQACHITDAHMTSRNDEAVQISSQKRRRLKPSKKRNCPACMYIREVVLFPDFALTTTSCTVSKHVLRKNKSTIIHDLKQAMGERKLNTIHRYFVQVPLPEAHSEHPHDTQSSSVRIIDPFVREKIDELLAVGVYELRHIQLIVHDYVNEIIVKKQMSGYPVNTQSYPSAQDINDYIYLSSISKQSSSGEEEECESTVERSQVQDEMEKSIQELMGLLQSCSDSTTVSKAKKEMKKVIQKMKRCGPVAKNFQRRPRKRNYPTKVILAAEQVKRPRISQSFTHSQPSCVHIITTSVPQVPQTIVSNSGDIMCGNSMSREMMHDVMLPFNGSLNSLQTHVDMMPTFSRLMEDDHDLMPSLVDRVVGPDPHFHPQLQDLGHLHDERLNSVSH
ncbi:uncharacterized protein LOC100187063 [Ciona intestinalis]